MYFKLIYCLLNRQLNWFLVKLPIDRQFLYSRVGGMWNLSYNELQVLSIIFSSYYLESFFVLFKKLRNEQIDVPE